MSLQRGRRSHERGQVPIVATASVQCHEDTNVSAMLGHKKVAEKSTFTFRNTCSKRARQDGGQRVRVVASPLYYERRFAEAERRRLQRLSRQAREHDLPQLAPRAGFQHLASSWLDAMAAALLRQHPSSCTCRLFINLRRWHVYIERRPVATIGDHGRSDKRPRCSTATTLRGLIPVSTSLVAPIRPASPAISDLLPRVVVRGMRGDFVKQGHLDP
ncbi:hypothetical protein HPB51_001591 [Rhipicephalus microplus]|uniref:Uncharacterized protein n=1 Tax=Rhipicephalus microplus TaxID=6941 RepID=A0A9J6DL05_RHIMP|nr:hypothetical protein HPB51_001591 [Rhipicephalus microplus]